MIIIGIDPGTTRVGYGVVKKDTNNTSYVASGLLAIDPRREEARKLESQRASLLRILKDHRPDAAAVEKLFFFKNAKTALAVAQARGVIIETFTEANIPIYEYTPLQVKQAVSTYGKASKQQVQKMIKLLLGLAKAPEPDDVADALAIAICCAHSIR